ncbi:hypothetical protein ACFQ3Z_19190 [Streptomyces nogalater]
MALPVAVVPPLVLMLVSQASPLYVDRYVLYALSGAPLLVACGAERVAGAVERLRPGAGGAVPPPGLPRPRPARGRRRRALGVPPVPLLRADREPGARADDLGAVSRAAGRRLGGGRRDVRAAMRNVALTYPRPFRGTRDVLRVAGAAKSGTLYGREAGVAELRRRLARLDRVWVVGDRRCSAPAGCRATPWSGRR